MRETKISDMTAAQVVAAIQQSFKDVPQVNLELESEIYPGKTEGFINVKLVSETRLWFYLSDHNNKTVLSMCIAIQDPAEGYEINNHHFIQIHYVSDMVELTNWKLGLNGRV